MDRVGRRGREGEEQRAEEAGGAVAAHLRGGHVNSSASTQHAPPGEGPTPKLPGGGEVGKSAAPPSSSGCWC